MKINEMRKGSYFTKKLIEEPKESQVWIRGDYDRSRRRYECTRFDDINTVCYLDGDRDVYVGFTF